MEELKRMIEGIEKERARNVALWFFTNFQKTNGCSYQSWSELFGCMTALLHLSCLTVDQYNAILDHARSLINWDLK